MKVQLYMATSTDGYIATKNGDSSWVSESDWERFSHMIKEAKVIVMGKNTYEVCVTEETFPFDNALNIVTTHDKELLAKPLTDSTFFTNKTPREIVSYAEEKGFSRLLVVGGMNLNGDFLKEDLIDEIYISVHPLLLGSGLRLFTQQEYQKKLRIMSNHLCDDGVVQVSYSIVK